MTCGGFREVCGWGIWCCGRFWLGLDIVVGETQGVAHGLVGYAPLGLVVVFSFQCAQCLMPDDR